jgi:methenyltetrahydromethanopterin cyclohydrolase
MISVNQRASTLVHRMIAESEALGFEVIRLKNGSTVIDAGVHTPGSMEGGRMFAAACMGGLGQVSFVHQSYEIQKDGQHSGFWLPAVSVDVCIPHIACMASQYAGWALKLGDYFAIASGPARALAGMEELYQKLEYRDSVEMAVLMLEGRTLPNEDVAAYVAEQCGVDPGNLFLLIAPTASLVGSIQIAARSVETGMHKMSELGFDVRKVTSASGLCPLAPVAADDMHAIGRTNDAILYGSQVFFTVRADNEELAQLIEKVPSASSRDYGTPFYELFMRYGCDFYQIDRLLFSPARVEINNLSSGRVFAAGQLNPSILQSSLLGC